jgi:ABC-2 type transport system ATP-binding protein
LGERHSVILSTHILPEVEAICDSVQILHKGKVVFDDEIKGLRKFRSGKSIQVSFRAPPTKEVLEKKLTNVKVSTVRDGVYRISGIELEDDPTDAIVQHSVHEQWGLFELVGAQASVEEVFVELTTQDEAAS